MPLQFSAALGALARPCLLFALALVAACGSDVETVDETVRVPPPAEPPAPPERDLVPPEFAGLERVELRGLEYYALHWSPATDNTSATDAIRYHVFHVVEPYVELSDDATPILISEPGATEVFVAHDAPPGRFYVRAADEAGNLSRMTSGLAQRSRRPWTRAADGSALARVTDCLPLGEGRALCVGDQGFVARWDGEGWQPVETGTTAEFRIVRSPAHTWLYSSVGHLVRLDEDAGPELVDVRFEGGRPSLPFRQFAEDGLGLRYWIDSEGVVWIGADRSFRRMERPLALPDADACTRLRALAFADAASFALCEDGAAFSANETQAGRRWQSLTPNAAFPLPSGLRGVLAVSDNEGLFYDDTGVRRVGVGGWRAILLTEYPPSVHPLDRPTGGPMPDRMGHLIAEGDTWFVVSDLGLLRYQREAWSVLRDTAGSLVGASPSGRASASGAWTLMYEGGAVAEWRRGRRRWTLAPDLAGFDWAGQADGGEVLARNEDGLWRWDGATWTRVRAGLPGGDVALVRQRGERWLAAGLREGAPALWTRSRGAWASATVRPLAPPPEPDPDAPAPEPEVDPETGEVLPPEPTPPPALEVDASAEPLALAPIVDADLSPDGRAIAVSERQVWWRVGGTWTRLTERPHTITGVALDSGETYVLIEGGVVTRCWRDECSPTGERPVAESTWAPESVLASWRSDAGLVALAEDGSTLLFAAASAPEGAASLIEPWAELPSGSWVEETRPPDAPVRDDVRMLVAVGDGHVVWTEGGQIYEAIGERWVLQGERDDILLALSDGTTWSIVTSRGVLGLGDVGEVHRQRDEEAR